LAGSAVPVPNEGGPRVVGLICASNVAWDPFERLSAHAIFTSVSCKELPFEFPQPFYVVVVLLGLNGASEHKVGLVPQAGVLEFESEQQDLGVDSDSGVAVLSVVHCRAFRLGRHCFTVTLDGKPLEPAFGFQVRMREGETK
jgi:hypothetical protein